jgi:hypothetical protein
MLAKKALAGRWDSLARETPLFLPVPDYAANALLRRDAPFDRVKRRYIGVTVPELEPSEALRRHRHGSAILFVGRLELLLKTVSCFLCPESCLTVLCGGPERSSLEELSRYLGIDRWIQFENALPQTEVFAR